MQTIHPTVHPLLSYADADDLLLQHLLHLEGREEKSRETLGEELEPPHIDGPLPALLNLIDLAARNVYAWRDEAEYVQEYTE